MDRVEWINFTTFFSFWRNLLIRQITYKKLINYEKSNFMGGCRRDWYVAGSYTFQLLHMSLFLLSLYCFRHNSLSSLAGTFECVCVCVMCSCAAFVCFCTNYFPSCLSSCAVDPWFVFRCEGDATLPDFPFRVTFLTVFIGNWCQLCNTAVC